MAHTPQNAIYNSSGLQYPFSPPHPIQRSGQPSPVSDIDENSSHRSVAKNTAYQAVNQVEGQEWTGAGKAQGIVWRPGFWRRFPVWGIASLLGALGCTIAGLCILVASDQKPTNEWGYGLSPSVYLSITSVVANALLAYALTEGLVISFWRTALKASSLSELHYNWLCGVSLVDAIINGFRSGGRITALACILAMVSVLRGPLNQRATSVESNVVFPTNGTVDLSLGQVLPEYYTGIGLNTRATVWDTERLTQNFSEVMNEYTSKSNLTMKHSYCGKQCSPTVKGFGFRPDCTKAQIIRTINDTTHGWDMPLFNTTVQLYRIANTTTIDYQAPFYAGIVVNATFRSMNEIDTNNGTTSRYTYSLTSHVCKLVGGIVEYKLNLRDDGTVSFVSNDWRNDRFVKEVNMTSPSKTGSSSDIGGFQYAGNYLFASEASLAFHVMTTISMKGALANQFLANSTEKTNLRFSDPMDYILNAYREISFRTALRAARDNATYSQASQSVRYQGEDFRNIYVTDEKYMIGAAIVSILGGLAVSLTYWGWWELGRRVSMSPFEVARAFDAPVFRGMSGNSGFRRFNNEKLRYGEDVNGRLVMGRVGEVRDPREGVRY